MDIIKVKSATDTETNKTSSHSGFHFIEIKQEEGLDSENEVSFSFCVKDQQH
jgi:hypothetical protein